MDEGQLREQLCTAAYQLWLRGLVVADGGQVTVEMHRRRFLALPEHRRRANLLPGELMLVDRGGQELYGDRSLGVQTWQPHRVAYHLELEQEGSGGLAPREPIRATAVVSPVHVQAALQSRRAGQTLALESWSVPMVAADDDAALGKALMQVDAVGIESVGLLVVGGSLEQVLNRAETLEHAAAVQWASGAGESALRSGA